MEIKLCQLKWNLITTPFGKLLKKKYWIVFLFNNKEIRKVWKTKKGEDIFEAAVKFLGEEHIDKNTEARVKRKYDRQQAKKEAINAQKKAQQLEKLFNHKLEVFEIEEIKKSKNRKLKAKIRRSKSIPEVNIYAMLIMKEELDIEGE
jgi:hypothetical protein